MLEISFLPARLMDADLRRWFEMETGNSTTPPRAAGATTDPKVGDRIVMCDVEGLLAADLRTSVFAPGYSREDWSYLSDGYLILDDNAGLVHVASDASPPSLLAPVEAARGADAIDGDNIQAAIRARLVNYDGRSPSILSETAVQFRGHAGFPDALVQLAGDPDRLVSEGATWILKSELEAGRRLDAQQTARLIEQRERITAWQAQLHLCQLVHHLDVPDARRDALRRWLERLLEAKRPFLRAWALYAICHLPGKPVVPVLDRMEQDPAASVRARVRQLRKRFSP